MRAVAIAVLLAIGSVHTAQARPHPAIPARCEPFTIPIQESRAQWTQLLSLASCMEDHSTVYITEPEDLAVAVDVLVGRAAPALAVYAWIADNAPMEYQLVAVYRIGVAEIELAVRARRSIMSPSVIGQVRYDELHVALEDHLVPALRVARAALDIVVKAGDPSSPEVVDAHRLLETLPPLPDARGTLDARR